MTDNSNYSSMDTLMYQTTHAVKYHDVLDYTCSKGFGFSRFLLISTILPHAVRNLALSHAESDCRSMYAACFNSCKLQHVLLAASTKFCDAASKGERNVGAVMRRNDCGKFENRLLSTAF